MCFHEKRHIVLIVIAAIVFVIMSSPVLLLFLDIVDGTHAEIEIDSYRLCKDKDGEDIIIIKYLLRNEGKESTALIYEGDFYVYQNGIGLTEYDEYDEKLPKECNYDAEDQFKNIKGGAEYYAEIAYRLEYPDEDVEVEVDDYGLFDGKKEKVFKIK